MKLEVIEPEVEEGVEETEVEPKQQVKFRCIAEGRPAPSVFYTWLPSNQTESGEVCENLKLLGKVLPIGTGVHSHGSGSQRRAPVPLRRSDVIHVDEAFANVRGQEP